MKPMTIDDVEHRIREIRENAPDFEVAHSLEVDLFRDALVAISEGMAYPNPEDFARAVLKARKVKFTRHCA